MFKIIATRRQRGNEGIMNDLERCGPTELITNCLVVKFDPFT